MVNAENWDNGEWHEMGRTRLVRTGSHSFWMIRKGAWKESPDWLYLATGCFRMQNSCGRFAYSPINGGEDGYTEHRVGYDAFETKEEAERVLRERMAEKVADLRAQADAIEKKMEGA